jgi:hypothetical protein
MSPSQQKCRQKATKTTPCSRPSYRRSTPGERRPIAAPHHTTLPCLSLVPAYKTPLQVDVLQHSDWAAAAGGPWRRALHR